MVRWVCGIRVHSPSIRRRHRGEIAVDSQALLLALFGVKLCRETTSPGDRGAEVPAVIAFAEHERAIRRYAVIAVNEIEGFTVARELRTERRVGLNELH